MSTTNKYSMKSFIEWIDERKSKLTAMRRWLWNQEHGQNQQKGSPPPVTQGDPDYEWIKEKSTQLGPLDPYKFE